MGVFNPIKFVTLNWSKLKLQKMTFFIVTKNIIKSETARIELATIN